jgi:hypothetical protein
MKKERAMKTVPWPRYVAYPLLWLLAASAWFVIWFIFHRHRI